MKHEAVDWQAAAQRLVAGEVGVVPTDTMYGIVGSALKPAAVERIYKIREREQDKPMIVLIGGWADFERLQITIPERTRNLLGKIWPGPVSVIVAAPSPALAYLHRGTGGIAFRMPAKPELVEVLKTVGPVVAPSANLAGREPATNIDEAMAYFGEDVFYVDEGTLNNPASALVDVRVDPPRILRPAAGFNPSMLG